jgi:protein tyrosine kinase
MGIGMEMQGIVIDQQYSLRERVPGFEHTDAYRASAQNVSVVVHFFRGYAGEESAQYEAFEERARILCRLSHPSIVDVLDFGCFLGRPYLITEDFAGTSLEAVLANDPTSFKPVEMSLTLGETLKHTHREGFTHDALKASSVIVAPDKTIKIAGVGLRGLADIVSGKAKPGAELDVSQDFADLDVLTTHIFAAAQRAKDDEVARTAASRAATPPPRPRAVKPTVPRSMFREPTPRAQTPRPQTPPRAIPPPPPPISVIEAPPPISVIDLEPEPQPQPIAARPQSPLPAPTPEPVAPPNASPPVHPASLGLAPISAQPIHVPNLAPAASLPAPVVEGSQPAIAAEGSRPAIPATVSPPANPANGSANGSVPASPATASLPASPANGSRPASPAMVSTLASPAHGSRPASPANASRPTAPPQQGIASRPSAPAQPAGASQPFIPAQPAIAAPAKSPPNGSRPSAPAHLAGAARSANPARSAHASFSTRAPERLLIDDDDFALDASPDFKPSYASWFKGGYGGSSRSFHAPPRSVSAFGVAALDPPWVTWVRRYFPGNSGPQSDIEKRGRTVNLVLTCTIALIALAFILRAL